MLEQLKRKRLQKPDLLSYQSPCLKEITWGTDWVSTAQFNQIFKLPAPRTIKKIKEIPQFFEAPRLYPTSTLGVVYNLIYCPIGTFEFEWSEPDEGRYSSSIKEIKKPFLLGETEVTRALYFTVMGLTDTPEYEALDSQVAISDRSVSSYLLFCNRLSELHGLDPCYDVKERHFDSTKNGYRLPTAEEWQYAAKADTENRYAGTNDLKKVKDYAIYSTDKKYLNSPQIVKQKKPNEWGFYDMIGNVLEFVHTQDLFTDDSKLCFGGSYETMNQNNLYDHGIGRVYFRWGSRDKEIGLRIARNLR